MQTETGTGDMNTAHSDILVHVSNPPDPRQRQTLVARLAAEPGVTQVRSAGTSGWLLLVHYDRRAISAVGILRCVTKQGYAASLVGM
jgi:hypothetical protein